MGRECKESGVLDCRIYGSGVVCLTNQLQLVCVTNLSEPRPRRLAETTLMQPPVSWVVVEPRLTLSQNLEVLLATVSGSLLQVDQAGSVDQLLSTGPYLKMALSPNGRLLATFNDQGMLWVMSSDFQKVHSQLNTKSKAPPEQMVWCGSDSVLLYWEMKILLMVGPNGEWFQYQYDEPLHLYSEPDGVRILSNTKTEFLHKLPDCTEHIFKIGSTHPAAMLYDAQDHFDKKSPKADENIRSIGDQLQMAVNACIDAAGYERDYALQRTLLKAASFGKSFLDRYDCQPFVEMCKTLKVLNAVNRYDIGIPLTLRQYRLLTPDQLLNKLIRRKQHFLALEICNYLSIRKDQVLVDWACRKVQGEGDDLEITRIIVDKLQKMPGISYAEIASQAYKGGRLELATSLLEYEPKAADQVPLLISMGQDETALAKAIESGDTDLVYLVILHIRRALPPADFFRLIRARPVALDLLISYSRQQDLKLLKDLYFQFEQPQETAHIQLLDAYQQSNIDHRIGALEEALHLFKEAKDTFDAKATDDQIRLLLLQKDLEATLGGHFVDLSLSDTMSILIEQGHGKRVQRIKSDFSVPDKRFWWIKLKALAKSRDWMALEKFSKEKSPIGYAPFAEICIEYKAPKEAEKYIPRIQDIAQRVDFYMRIGAWMDAATTAKAKDPNLLQLVRSKCPRDYQLRIEQLMQQGP
eukprot:TRINITY_DN9916_c0_g1_i1.p1 TRINITY_DN9916_c0_g1~~TRINITY_DN9916_c0_g1_i1.p1  ORF type:complete len:794 (-),score=201.81 TRINITY_DN9916_c0_g1_i1:37-2124(-)